MSRVASGLLLGLLIGADPGLAFTVFVIIVIAAIIAAATAPTATVATTAAVTTAAVSAGATAGLSLLIASGIGAAVAYGVIGLYYAASSAYDAYNNDKSIKDVLVSSVMRPGETGVKSWIKSVSAVLFSPFIVLGAGAGELAAYVRNAIGAGMVKSINAKVAKANPEDAGNTTVIATKEKNAQVDPTIHSVKSIHAVPVIDDSKTIVVLEDLSAASNTL
ncbi:MAG: hypothetical protein WC627_04675 [Legionella sp.]